MSSAQKIIQAAAGNAAGEGLYVEEVFSTYLYEGNDSTQVIENGIALGDTVIESATPSNTTASSLRSGSAGEDFFVESSGGVTYGIFNSYLAGEFLKVDFSHDVTVTQVTYRNEVGTNWAPTSVLIQSSSDGSSWTTELTYSDNNTTNKQTLSITSGTSARYWRMYQNSDTRGGSAGYEWHITQFSMTGTSVSSGTGEGGLVWAKNRTATWDHVLFDTERGIEQYLQTNETDAEAGSSGQGVTSYNSDGFTLASSSLRWNSSSNDYASWTFRKAPKFFDVVTYTGDGTLRDIPHNLGSVPGTIIVKRTDGTNNWYVQHRSTGPTKSLFLDTTSAATTRPEWGNTAPTDSVFTVDGTTVTATNYNGFEYVAYLFAHNDGDGEFGEDADQDIIKCGSYTADGSGNASVNLGFEPQWLMIKSSSATQNWVMIDNMRGLVVGGTDPTLYANLSNAEYTAGGGDRVNINATGFDTVTARFNISTANESYIYIAIRRGPMKTPESGTEVFAVDTRGATGGGTPPALRSGFPVDWVLWRNNKNTSASTEVYNRMLASYLITDTTAAEVAYSSSPANFAFNNGWFDNTATDSNDIAWMFRRAPGFFDVVAWDSAATGDAISHNLGVKPELIIAKIRDQVDGWYVYHKDLGATKRLRLDLTAAESTTSNVWNDTEPTASDFTVGGFLSVYDYIAYLFATVPGVSKVGSFSHTSGSTTDVDCGFTNGARFVLIKRTSATGPWALWDSERGIVSGTEKYLALDSTAAETDDGGTDYIDPLSSGFQMTGSLSTADYIFLAIA